MQTKTAPHTLTAVLPRLSRLKVGSLPLWLTALLVGVLALLPRCLGLADFFTEDESFHWVWRVRHFSGAVRQELWVGTNLTGHPGVTTMWLGTLGRWLADALGVPEAGLAEGSANIAYLAMLRLPLALVNTLAVVVGYLVLRRLLRPAAALLAGVLWATSPFLVAHSRLLHLDALLTCSFCCWLPARPFLVLPAHRAGDGQRLARRGDWQGWPFSPRRPRWHSCH
jgi:dolichyl-phosphate-mannose--protein O-mannosyl transferase